jgi:hypothetical protein
MVKETTTDVAKPAPLALREYDVHLEGWPKLRIEDLSSEAAELAYRQQLQLRRKDLKITVVDITAQREKNGGLSDAEMKQRQRQAEMDKAADRQKEAVVLQAATAETERKAREFLDSVAQQKQLVTAN